MWPSLSFCLDLQKLEREARICRLLKHANIGGYINRIYYLFFSDEKTSDAKEIDKKKENNWPVWIYKSSWSECLAVINFQRPKWIIISRSPREYIL